MVGPRRRNGRPAGPLLRFGERVAARRRALGLTQREVTDLADVGISSLYDIEHGSDRVTLAVVLRVLDVLGLELVTEPRERLTGRPDAPSLRPDRPR